MTAQDIAHLRLVNQSIAQSCLKKPSEVVASLGAVQAQDYGQAVWAVGLRTQSATIVDIEQALADGEILRTWPMRGTIHFVTARDVKWMLRLLAPRILASDRRRREQLDIDDKVLGRAEELFWQALQGGKRLTRPAMMKLLDNAGINPKGQRGYHILWHLAQKGLLFIGPMEGKQQTFMLLDEWVPYMQELSREESLAKLARRYFTSHGPATVNDFAAWAGLVIADAKLGLDLVKLDLIAETVDCKDYWMSRDIPTVRHSAVSDIYLLPGFDEYLLGYKDRGATLAAEYAPKVYGNGNGMFFPLIVSDGRIRGVWKRVIKKNAVEIAFGLFEPLGNAAKELTVIAGRYGEFIGLPVKFTGV